jgi:hypothetical protein
MSTRSYEAAATQAAGVRALPVCGTEFSELLRSAVVLGRLRADRQAQC